MSRILAAVVTLLLAVAFVLLVAAMLSVVGLSLCSEPGNTGDCIEGTSTERLLGLVLGFAAVGSAGLGAWWGIRFVRNGTGAPRLAAAVVATPVLALGALALLPVSFETPIRNKGQSRLRRLASRL